MYDLQCLVSVPANIMEPRPNYRLYAHTESYDSSWTLLAHILVTKVCFMNVVSFNQKNGADRKYSN